MSAKVKWRVVHIPPVDVLEDHLAEGMPMPTFPSTDYSGEVIGTVRVWGETKLVVLLDSGKVVEVNAKLVGDR